MLYIHHNLGSFTFFLGLDKCKPQPVLPNSLSPPPTQLAFQNVKIADPDFVLYSKILFNLNRFFHIALYINFNNSILNSKFEVLNEAIDNFLIYIHIYISSAFAQGFHNGNTIKKKKKDKDNQCDLILYLRVKLVSYEKYRPWVRSATLSSPENSVSTFFCQSWGNN